MAKFLGGLSTDGFVDAGYGFRHGSSTTPTWTTGTGTPEGAVTAPIGSMFSRVDGGTDTTVYRKEAGVGNIGWVAVTNSGTGGGAVASVDGRTGVVTLADKYVDVTGDNMTGNLGMGVTPTSKLHFAAATTAVGGILFGTDTNLYRGAADTLRTDDTLQIGTYHGLYASPGGRASIGADLAADTMLSLGSYGSPNAFSTTSPVYGVRACPVNTGTGNVTGLMAQALSPASPVTALWGAVINTRYLNTTGTLTNAISISLPSPAISAGAAVTNAYGIDMAAQKVTGVTTGYAIYQRGTGDYNVLLGNTGLGVTAPTLSRLQFPAGTLAADGITWGTDTKLYRNAASALRTDGSFSSGATIDAVTGFRHGSAVMPSWTTGTGAPEGLIAAPIGSLFSRIDGSSNATIYRKESGIGATGWVATSTSVAGVTSVDGRTGAATLSDLYVDVTGDTMTGALNAPVVAVGSNPAASGALRLTAGTTAADGIQFGADTSLYRSAPTTVKTDGSAQVTGRLSIGGNVPTAEYKLRIDHVSPVAGYQVGAFVNNYWANAADAALPNEVGGSDAWIKVAAAASTTVSGGGMAYGAGGLAIVDGDGAVPSAVISGVIGRTWKYGTSTIGSLRTFTAFAPQVVSGPGNITNAYGIFIGPHKIVGVTNGYGVYQAGTSDLNYFAGQVQSVSFRQGSAGPTWTSGAGSPESVIAAPIGSLYSRTDGGIDTTIYRKETGVATTGWVATSADAVTSVDGRIGAVTLADKYVDVTGDTMTGTLVAPISIFTQSTALTAPFGAPTAVSIRNLDGTSNNWSELAFTSASHGAVTGIGSRTTDHATNRGEMWFYGRSAAGWKPRLRIPEAGGLDIYGDTSAIVANVTSAGLLMFADSVSDKIQWYSGAYKTGIASNTLYHDVPAGANVHEFRVGGVNKVRIGTSAIILASGVIAESPSGFRQGSVLAPSWTAGVGTPEGVVTAVIGSMFSRTDGSTGSSLYRKESGTGNTGWVATSAAPPDAVTSVDGRTGLVTLADKYVDVTGDTMTGNLLVEGPYNNFALTARQTGDVRPRVIIRTQGLIELGDGLGPTNDTNLYRSAADTLRTDDSFSVGVRVDAASGFRQGDSTKPAWTSGSGSPEGVVTAPVGSMYSRVDGSNGSAIYRKETGVGTTGWAADAQITISGYVPIDGSYAATTTDVMKSRVTGNAQPQFVIDTNGNLQWGDGTSPPDANLYRTAVNQIQTNGALVATGAMAASRYRAGSSTDAPWTGYVYSQLHQGTPNAGGLSGFASYYTLPSTGTGSSNWLYANVVTQAASFTAAYCAGLQIAAPVVGAGSTITNLYGVDIAAQKTAGVTNGYGIYQRGASDYNLFAGVVQLLNANTIFGEGANLALGTTTGTKFGTTNTQKIGFWNVTPVVQNAGWSVTVGYVADKVFNPESTTVTELARTLGTLIDTLKSYGLLGP